MPIRLAIFGNRCVPNLRVKSDQLGSVLIRTTPASNQDTQSTDRNPPDPLPPSSIDPPPVIRPT